MKLKDATQKEIENLVSEGRKVYWKNTGYKVIKDNLGQYLIVFHSGDCVGLKSEFCNKTTSNDFILEG